MSDSIFCEDCGKTLMQSKGEYDHGCLDCHGSVQSEKLFWLRKENKAQAQEIQKLKADREVLVNLARWIDQTDISQTTPDFLWLQNWRNTRKEAARQSLKSIGETE